MKLVLCSSVFEFYKITKYLLFIREGRWTRVELRIIIDSISGVHRDFLRFSFVFSEFLFVSFKSKHSIEWRGEASSEIFLSNQ